MLSKCLRMNIYVVGFLVAVSLLMGSLLLSQQFALVTAPWTVSTSRNTNGHRTATRPPMPDPRIHAPKLVHPYIDHEDQGQRVYYGPEYFLYDNRTAPLRGTCDKSTPDIDPYEAGRRALDFTGGMYPDCATIHFSTSRRLPLVALATAPGSGNTWVRHFIQQLTGIYTGAVYYDPDLYQGGFLGEYHSDPSVVAIKTHEHWNCSLMPPRKPGLESFLCPRYQKAILVVRDPHEAILAETNRFNTNQHIGSVREPFFHSARWYKTAMLLAKRWFQTFEVWSQFGNYKELDGCLLIVSFKHLQTRLREELVRIGQFLGVKSEYLRGDHLECVVQNSEGSFKRRRERRRTMDIYDSRVNATIAVYKKRVNDILKYLDSGFTV